MEKTKEMIKQWIQDFLGISDIKTKLHNMDGDIMSMMNKQLNPLLPVPVDPPECAKDSPYEYKPTQETKYSWFVLWPEGFAGPFPDGEEARDYAKYNGLILGEFCRIEKLCPIPFEKKCEKKTS